MALKLGDHWISRRHDATDSTLGSADSSGVAVLESLVLSLGGFWLSTKGKPI